MHETVSAPPVAIEHDLLSLPLLYSATAPHTPAIIDPALTCPLLPACCGLTGMLQALAHQNYRPSDAWLGACMYALQSRRMTSTSCQVRVQGWVGTVGVGLGGGGGAGAGVGVGACLCMCACW